MNTYMNVHTERYSKEELGNLERKAILANLQKSAAHALTNCRDNLFALLDKQGISIPPAIQLAVGLDSYVIVEGKRADAAVLEEILNKNTEMATVLQEVEVLHRMLHQLTNLSDVAAESLHIGVTSLGCVAFFTQATS